MLLMHVRKPCNPKGEFETMGEQNKDGRRQGNDEQQKNKQKQQQQAGKKPGQLLADRENADKQNKGERQQDGAADQNRSR